MTSDEQSIRQLVATWHRATASGDVSQILGLMSDDVVFLVTGQPPMRGRHSFEKGLRTLLQHHRIDSDSEIQEIEVSGNWAYCWNRLSITITPLEGGAPTHRSGDTLSIFHKGGDGAWALVRDANMLSVSPSGKS